MYCVFLREENVAEINSSKSGVDERLRQAREEYRTKESELVKKHNKEIRRITEKNMEDIEGLRESHSSQMNNLRQKSRETMTRRDAKYQKEINEMRKMHHENLKKMTKNHQQVLNATKEAARKEARSAKLNKEDRVGDLLERHSNEIQSLNKSYHKNMQEAREKQKEDFDNFRSNVADKHAKEIDELQHKRDIAISEIKRDSNRTKNVLREQLKNEKIKNFEQNQKSSNRLIDAVKEERANNQQVVESQRVAFQEGYAKQSEKFVQKMEEMKEGNISALNENNRKVGERLKKRVDSLELDNRKLKNANVRERLALKADSEREVRMAKESYEAKYKLLLDQREELKKAYGEKNAADIRGMVEEHNKNYNELNDYYKNRIDVENFRNRNAHSATESFFKNSMKAQATQADLRVDKMLNEFKQMEIDLQKRYEEDIKVLKEGHEDEKREMALRMNQERLDALQNLRDRSQEVVRKNSVERDMIKAKYEQQISDMKNKHRRDMKLKDRHEEYVVSEIKRGHTHEIASLRDQYEVKSKEAQKQHKSEIETLNRKHNEKMDQVLATIQRNENDLNKV